MYSKNSPPPTGYAHVIAHATRGPHPLLAQIDIRAILQWKPRHILSVG